MGKNNKFVLINDSGFSLENEYLVCNYGSGCKIPVKEINSVNKISNTLLIELNNGDTYVFSKRMNFDQWLIFLLLLLFVCIIGGIIYGAYADSKNKKIVENSKQKIMMLINEYEKQLKQKNDEPVTKKNKTNDLDKIESLKKWKELLDQNIISEEEFQQKKNEIMNDDC